MKIYVCKFTTVEPLLTRNENVMSESVNKTLDYDFVTK